jgi:MFS family permease
VSGVSRREVREALKGNIGVFIVSSGLWSIGGNLTNPFFALYVLALGGTYFDIGLISAVESVCRVALTFFGGSLADSVGRKKLVYLLSFLLAAINLVFFFAPSWEYLLLGRAVSALIGGFRGPAFNAILADSTAPANRALAYSLWQRLPPLFGLASPIIAGNVLDAYGTEMMRWFYLAAFALSAIASFIRFKYLAETHQGAEGPARRRVVALNVREFTGAVKSVPRQLWVITGISFLFSFGFHVAQAFWVTYAVTEVELRSAEWGVTTSIITVTNALFAIPLSLASDRYGRLKFVVASLLLTAIPLVAFPFSGGFGHVVLVRVLYSLFGCLRWSPLSALRIDYTPHALRGRINAVINIMSSPSSTFGNLLGGYLYQDVSRELPFFVDAGLFALCGILFLLLVKEPRMREK